MKKCFPILQPIITIIFIFIACIIYGLSLAPAIILFNYVVKSLDFNSSIFLNALCATEKRFTGFLPNVAGVEPCELSRIELGEDNAYVTCEIICFTGKRVADSDHFLRTTRSSFFLLSCCLSASLHIRTQG